jgi:phosphate transport system substrate-binding protein
MPTRLLARTLSHLALLGLCLGLTPADAEETITGAGSSAAAPVYRIWAQEYKKEGGAALAYEAVGSSAGMERIRQRQADFGASDVIAAKGDLAKDGLVMFPTVISGVVPVVNLPRVNGQIRLNGELLARIYLGEIKQWNAPEIARLNPKATLPDLPIKVVCRADGSGTTYHFTDYLSKVSPAWKSRFGAASKHPWPADFVAVKGSTEVSKTVRATVGAIAYIDYNYAVDDKLVTALLANAAGRFLAASPETFRAAVINSRWFSQGDFAETLTDLPGETSWPITMGTYVAVPKAAADTARAARTLRFFAWAYGHGDGLASQAKFVPLPEKVQARVFREISSIQGAKGELIGVEAIKVLVKTGG